MYFCNNQCTLADRTYVDIALWPEVSLMAVADKGKNDYGILPKLDRRQELKVNLFSVEVFQMVKR